jgi:hypothetical protein
MEIKFVTSGQPLVQVDMTNSELQKVKSFIEQWWEYLRPQLEEEREEYLSHELKLPFELQVMDTDMIVVVEYTEAGSLKCSSRYFDIHFFNDGRYRKVDIDMLYHTWDDCNDHIAYRLSQKFNADFDIDNVLNRFKDIRNIYQGTRHEVIWDD